MLDGDVKRIFVLTVCVMVGVTVRLSGEVGPAAMVLAGEVCRF